MAVSDTHLDVYKRQAARTAAKIFDFILLILLFYLIAACNFGKMTRIVSVSFLQSAVTLPPIFSVSSLAMDNPSPVAYTHLDVYKRQPAHFVREAKKALISEAQYQNRTIPYTDDGSFFDDEWNDAEEHFLTPSIVFLEPDNANQSSGWNRDAYRLEKKLLEYYTGRDLLLNQCYTFKTDRHHPVSYTHLHSIHRFLDDTALGMDNQRNDCN